VHSLLFGPRCAILTVIPNIIFGEFQSDDSGGKRVQLDPRRRRIEIQLAASVSRKGGKFIGIDSELIEVCLRSGS
jgi:hypothetical protein